MLPVPGHGRAAVAGPDGPADDLSATRKARWTGGVFGGRYWRDVVGVRLGYPGQGPRGSVVPGAGNGVGHAVHLCTFGHTGFFDDVN